jgi:nickel transport protein
MKTFHSVSRYNWNRILARAIGLTVFCMLWPVTAGAHRIMVFAWVEGDTVHTESKFSGRKRVNGGEIVVYDLEGKELLSGKTDAKGEFSFKMPGKTGLKIVIQAGMGHRGEWTIPASEIVTPEPVPGPTVSEKAPPPMSKPQVGLSSASLEQIQGVLEKSLDQRLNPILKMLAESREKGPTLQDILGGIGYILGLMGLAAYIHFRRKSAEIAAGKKV